MPVALETFVKELADSGVIAPGKLENFIPPKAQPKDAQELARRLVQSKHLTKYQAQEICAGQAKSLILGNYTILDKIGAGGMGQVFKAEHRRMHRIVAIKVLPENLTKEEVSVARFQREVEAAAKLEHPNIVTAHDADEANGIHFLVMQYVDGSDLSALVKSDGPVSVEKALNYVLQAAKGLEFAHGEGVIHRDIKPGNLLLDKKGVIKILDMGLARIQGDGDAVTQAELTGTGAVMGTADYMSPEQASNPKHADARADIYSLGCTLYYLLVGKPTYGGETVIERILAHREKPIPSLGPTVPARLQAAFEKMVAKDVADRYQTMPELVAALEQCELGQATSVGAREVGSGSRSDAVAFLRNVNTARKPNPKSLKNHQPAEAHGSRRRLVFAASGAGILTLIVAAGVLLKLRTGDIRSEHPVSAPPVAANPVLPEGPPEPAKAPFDARQARAYQEAWAKYLRTEVETTNSIGMKMILIPPGEFLMGSTDEQVETAIKKSVELHEWPGVKDRIRDAERPQHKVVLTKPLAMSATLITIGQFRQFIKGTKYVTLAEKFGGNAASMDEMNPGKKELNWQSPGYVADDESPVTQIAWEEAVKFCNWLCEQEKLPPSYRHDARDGWVLLPGATGYRLPTEAEWEYACRAGTTTQNWFGDDPAELAEYGWYVENSGLSARAVGLKPANPFALYDMHGNVQEWCADWIDDKWFAVSPTIDPKGPPAGSERLIRGGGWRYGAGNCRSAYRRSSDPATRFDDTGFRVVRGMQSIKATMEPVNVGPVVRDPGSARQAWDSPAFSSWMNDVAALAADKQLEAVAKKLQDLNPGFDGKLTGLHGVGMPRIENGVVTELRILTDNITDISPVKALTGLRIFQCPRSRSDGDKTSGELSLLPLRGMSLVFLDCFRTDVSDLSPLRNMPLLQFYCHDTKVSDLSPLRGLPIGELWCQGSLVSDLSPLADCKNLTILNVGNTKVKDLSPLKGLPLTKFSCDGSNVFDLSPLAGMSLTVFYFSPKSITKGIDSIRQMKTLTKLGPGWGQPDFSPDEFWKKYDAGEFK